MGERGVHHGKQEDTDILGYTWNYKQFSFQTSIEHLLRIDMLLESTAMNAVL